MEGSSSDAWLNNSFICPNSQPDHPPPHAYSLYPSDLLPLHPSGYLGNLNENQPGVCNAFGQPFHQSLGPEFHRSSQLYNPELSCFVEDQQLPHPIEHPGNQTKKGAELADPASARKIHKADREKLRRDRLNEQFIDLANALDSDRPKNDKATILSDCIQVLTELRSQVKRLKVDHTALLDESRDLTNEKIELREEKIALKNETEQLQCQLQQRVRLLLSWTGMDPSLMMGTPSFPYPLPTSSAPSAPPNSQQATEPAELLPPVVAAAPYVPFVAAHGSFAVHPSLQAYTMFANRPGNANIPFFPYPSVGSHSHIERPFAQYPSPLHPVPGYAVQSQPEQVSRPLTSIAQPTHTSRTPCPLTVPSTTSNEEKALAVHDQGDVCAVQDGVRLAVEEEQETACLLPDSRCPSDLLPLRSADSSTQPTQIVSQLQKFISEASKDASASFLEVEEEIKETTLMPSATSFSQLQTATPACPNKHKIQLVTQASDQALQLEAYSVQCLEPDLDYQHDQLMRPPAA